MPGEQIEWSLKESLNNGEKLRRKRQCCTYYSIVNVNKGNYPYSSSFEQEQTWILTRKMSNIHKRYQSSIDNIHLSMPSKVFAAIAPLSTSGISSSTTHLDSENNKIKKDRSNSLLPPLPPSRQHASISSLRATRGNVDSIVEKIMTSTHSNSKKNSIIEKRDSNANPMRVVHLNGEIVVRI